MAPKKLSESEKKEIVQLYSKPEESTSTLASRFGVSSSTISRVLKQGLSDDEYNALVQKKRSGSQSIQSLPKVEASTGNLDSKPKKRERLDNSSSDSKPETQAKPSSRKPTTKKVLSSQSTRDESAQTATSASASSDIPQPKSKRDEEQSRRRRKRSRTTKQRDDVDEAIQLPITQLNTTNGDGSSEEHHVLETVDISDPDTDIDSAYSSNYPHDKDEEEDDELIEAIEDDLLGDDDDFSDDLEDDDDDFMDDDDDEIADDTSLEPLHFKREDLVQIYPFSTADLPRTCYLVIDRSAELITRPLQEFGELGDLPSAELSENTLPVFDNHRVAKRFANRRTQRIVKIPDSRILRKTTPYLQSKGITRLLIDGQVYSLIE